MVGIEYPVFQNAKHAAGAASDHQGHLKRTYLDGKFVTAEFIPVDKE